MFKRLTLLFAALVFAMPTVQAAEDLSGKWSGKFNITMEGQTREDVAYAVIKHTGADFAGTIGPNAGEQWTISKGKVEETKEATKVTFDVLPPSGEGIVKFELALVKGHLVGKATMTAGEGRVATAEVDLERVK